MNSLVKLVASAAVLAVILTGCGSPAPVDSDRTVGLRALISTDNGAGAALAHTKAEQPYLIGAIPFCVDKDPAQITSVRFDQPLRGTLQLTEWGVRSTDAEPVGEDDPGAVAGTISQYYGFTHQPISTTCDHDKDATTELLLQLERTGTQSATVQSVLVDYTIGNRHGEARQQLEISLCADGDPFAQGRCQ